MIIARLRAEKKPWSQVIEALEGWSLAKKRAYVRRTNPAPPPSVSPEPSPPALGGAPSVPALSPRHPEADTTTELQAPAALSTPLLAGRSFVMASVLPGLALIVDHDAPPLVQRIAAEIVEKYGVMPRDGGR